MKVLKFGGTSVGSIENLQRIKRILENETGCKIVVCSAMSGVTDQLIDLAEHIKSNNYNGVNDLLISLKNRHSNVINKLIDDDSFKEDLFFELSVMMMEIFEMTKEKYSEQLRSKIITFGEHLLTFIFSKYLKFVGIHNALLDAKEFMCIDSVDRPNIDKVSKKLKSILAKEEQSNLYITQGFVCRNIGNEIDHLRRGGSDYTATIIGAALNVEEVQIWTDIGGVHNNDPRYVSGTEPISYINYKEASKLAYFGAKILHPKTVSPVMEKNISVRVKNTFEPETFGTVISNKVFNKGIKAISAKDDITLIKFESNNSLMSYRYFKKIFDIFDTYKTSIDMITTSEVEMLLAISETEFLENIEEELKNYAKVIIRPKYSVICIAGESIIEDVKSYKIFDILNYIPIKMISYLGSNSIGLLVETKDKVNTLQLLNELLFENYAMEYAV